MRGQEGPCFIAVDVFFPHSECLTNVVCFLVDALVPMDARLVKDDADEDEDGEEEEEEPTIQLKLDLGNIKDNPLIQLLAPDDQDQQQPFSIMETITTTINPTAENAVTKLLQASKVEISTVRKEPKALIEEMT